VGGICRWEERGALEGICTPGEEICEQEDDILSAWEEICKPGGESLRAWVETCTREEIPSAWGEI